MKLVICEKPSVAKAVASALGVTSRADGCFEGNGLIVSWCMGHLVSPMDAAGYDPGYKKWKYDDLPILPEPFRYVLAKDKEDAFQNLKRLMDREDVTELVNACDAGREGELIFRLVYEMAGCRKPFSRLWISSMEDAAIREGFQNLRPGAEYDPLYQSALCRQKADWLIGINATRLFSVLYHRTLNVGRVQTPTLALVVNRDREIAAFTPIDYLVLQATLQHDAGMFSALFKPSEPQPGLDSEGRLVDGATVQGIMDAVRGKNGIITSVTREKKKKPVPLPHCLSSLQKAASSKLGMTAQQILDTAQSLYEKKLTTYPRTDCRYLPEEQFGDTARIITALSGLEAVTAKADSALRGPVWDTKKITAHHAIIPTGEEPRSLTAQEKELYLMIAVQYFLQFYPPMLYEAQKILATIVETAWEARGRMIIEPGWTGFAAEEDDEDAKKKEAEQSLPSVGNNDAVLCADVDALKKKTTPPSRFSEGSLIEAMANVHRFVSDAKAKAVLKENEGIGTEATRASILETLKGRGFIAASGKSLVSTPLGQSLIDMTPDTLRDPVTTAQWEQRLEAITRGETSLEDFMREQYAALPLLLAPVLSTFAALQPGAFPCPKCGKALRRREGKNAGEFFWSCSDADCRTFLPDEDGKRERAIPSEYPCPVCGRPLYSGKNDRGTFATTNKGIRTITMSFCPMTTAPPASPKKSLREW